MASSRSDWRFKSLAFAGLVWSLPVLSAQLSPQTVFDNFAKRSVRLQNIQLEARGAEAGIGAASGIFDPELGVRIGNEISRAETLSGLGNLEDRTLTGAASLRKRFATGTQLEAQYGYTRQQSRVNPFTSSLRSPVMYENRFTLVGRQNLIYNAFGSADRRRLEAAEKNDAALKLASVENSETLLLQTLSQFWTTYRAKERLNLALEARRIYDNLLKDVRQKRSLGLVDPADVSRTAANFERQDQTVKQASADYLDNVAKLYDLMDEPVPPETEEITFSIPTEIPEPPKEELAAQDSLRQTQIVEAQLEAIDAERSASNMEDMPILDLVGEASWNGVDREGSRSFSESLAGTRPRYYVGVEFGFRFGNKGARGKLGDLANRSALTKNNLSLTRRNIAIQGSAMQRQLASAYRVALSSQQAKEHYRQLLASQQRQYRVGRIDLSQLILDYTSLFDAELVALDDFASYHQLRHEWAALNDTLFKEETVKN
jgi:outer membrane protein TolC